ncbi:MAG: L-threonylcarbamoyladenylate synthase, partial [Betaproteobacteria bacterium]|nr:L-threonylcarbamoyladenylate synthase [Betaproteobacteria bacterium]
GADALNPVAVARVFAAKDRPADHPLIVHLADQACVPDWATEFPETARQLARAFWPGPLTLVLPRSARVPAAVTGGQDSVALRVPAHPVAQALLRSFGGGIAAPSANRYGRVSPTRAEHVREELGDRVALVLDGGECAVGLESTIVSCLAGQVALLRPGMIGRDAIEAVVGPLAACAAVATPRVPGSQRVHYAPAVPVELLGRDQLERRCAELAAAGATVAVIARGAATGSRDTMGWHVAPVDAAGYGHDLYATLRTLDRSGASRILIEQVPATGPWEAVRDRLQRAAAKEPPDDT